jgi:hypothetical protein
MVRTDPDMQTATVLKLVHSLHRISFIQPQDYSVNCHANAKLLLAELAQRNFKLVFGEQEGEMDGDNAVMMP